MFLIFPLTLLIPINGLAPETCIIIFLDKFIVHCSVQQYLPAQNMPPESLSGP